MTSQIEKGLVDVLAVLLPDVTVLPGAGGKLPSDAQVVIAKCIRVPHVAGKVNEAGSIYDAHVELCIETPMLSDALNEQDHRDLQGLVLPLIESANQEAFTVALTAYASMELTGWYLWEPMDQHGDSRWRTTLKYTLALTRV